MMNKRLEELYLEVCGKDWRYDFDPDLAEQFAGLIVKECAGITDDNLIPYHPNTGAVYYDGIQSKKIKEHFGV